MLWLEPAGSHLLEAPHLGEYDAVVLDDQPASIDRHFAALPPGKAETLPRQTAKELQHHLRQRCGELCQLLISGGVLVVRLRALAGVHSTYQGMLDLYPTTDEVCLSNWWIPAATRLSNLMRAEQQIISAATGDRILVEEPHHCFEPYLMTARYAAVLEPLVFSDPNDRPEVLARNRVGNVVACQIDVGSGCILLLPADGDRDVLEGSLSDLLLLRRGYEQSWRVPEENALLQRYGVAAEHMRTERRLVLNGLDRVHRRKARVFEDTDVRRVLSRLEHATKSSTSAKTSLTDLYNLVEIIKGRLGGGDEGLINTLGISRTTLEAVKRPANDKHLDVRHSTTGEPQELKSETVLGALKAAEEIVQTFIDHLYNASG